MYLYGIYSAYGDFYFFGGGVCVKVDGTCTWEVAFGARDVERLWVPCRL